MCLFPITVRTRLAARQHGVSLNSDHSMLPAPTYMTVPCGKCYDCRRMKARDWRFRLYHEIAHGNHSNAVFVTLTLSDEYYDPQTPPAQYIRRFLDRLRVEFGHSLKHWFTHEYGTDPDGTHRLHFHGIIFDWPDPRGTLRKIAAIQDVDIRKQSMRHWNDAVLAPLWAYGFTYAGHTCDVGTALYVTKYITKGYLEHYQNPDVWIFPPRIYCSSRIGICYLPHVRRRRDALRHSRIYDSIGTCRYMVPTYYTRKVMTCTDVLIRQLYDPPSLEMDDPRKWFVFGERFATYPEFLAHRERAVSWAQARRLGPRTFENRPRLTIEQYVLCPSLIHSKNRVTKQPISI